VAVLYLEPEPNVGAHRTALRSLLQLSPACAAQIPYILGNT
jgi:hypothetical protein